MRWNKVLGLLLLVSFTVGIIYFYGSSFTKSYANCRACTEINQKTSSVDPTILWDQWE
ncbi:hypothetical protein [Risungbinella massiliensis]|uniref:hypothetical protein n=1 Tax=Risungbinella massiliensis TaxID=1329796 RepID=UPI0012B5AA8E|nr:hypothetical protein [Risungbinella massiliensis]